MCYARYALLGLVLTLAVGPAAAAAQSRSADLGERRQVSSIDRLAASDFRARVSEEEARVMEAETAARYVAAPPAVRAEIRERRRAVWNSLSNAERMALRSAKTPIFANLSDEQKAPYRARAIANYEALSPTEQARIAAADKL